MNGMNEHFDKNAEEAAAFQKIWAETMSRLMQAAFTFSPNSPPPEVMGQIRSGIFQALAESWEQFMRSPQFLEGMKQWMENAIAFRKMTNNFMGRVRNEMQAPSRGDIDSIMLTVRHMETRLLDRVEQLAAQVAQLGGKNAGTAAHPRAKPRARSKRKSALAVKRRTPGNRKPAVP
jgi:hypothetical protein